MQKKFRQFLDHFFFVFLTIGETGRFTGANQFQFKSFSKSNFGRFLTGFFGFRPNRPDRFWVRQWVELGTFGRLTYLTRMGLNSLSQ
jgi:hypothetical protein